MAGLVDHLRGWLDYDRPSLNLLAPTERIDYFEKRVRMVVVTPLERVLTNEVNISPDTSAVLIFGVSLCCAIEATGKFLTGGKNEQDKNQKRFFAFLNGYMSSEYQSQTVGGQTYGQVLWRHFRNGLAHGFAVRHGGFEGNRGEAYFATRQIAGQDSLLVNPYLLFHDYLLGLGRYLAELRRYPPSDQLFVDFNKVFDEVFIRGE
jgi:hypothetical protein